jgi:hypothetical protein
MCKWGLVVTLFYALVIAALVVPGAVLLIGPGFLGSTVFYEQVKEAFSAWGTWVAVSWSSRSSFLAG